MVRLWRCGPGWASSVERTTSRRLETAGPDPLDEVEVQRFIESECIPAEFDTSPEPAVTATDVADEVATLPSPASAEIGPSDRNSVAAVLRQDPSVLRQDPSQREEHEAPEVDAVVPSRRTATTTSSTNSILGWPVSGMQDPPGTAEYPTNPDSPGSDGISVHDPGARSGSSVCMCVATPAYEPVTLTAQVQVAGACTTNVCAPRVDCVVTDCPDGPVWVIAGVLPGEDPTGDTKTWNDGPPAGAGTHLNAQPMFQPAAVVVKVGLVQLPCICVGPIRTRAGPAATVEDVDGAVDVVVDPPA